MFFLGEFSVLQPYPNLLVARMICVCVQFVTHSYYCILKKYFLFMYVGCVCVCARVCRTKRVLVPLELKSQAILNCQVCVLGTELWPTVNAASILNR